MKRKNSAPAVNIMSLEFFARHFNFPVAWLQWGIVEVTRDGETNTACAVLVKDKSLYIGIRAGKIRPCVNGDDLNFNLIPCEMQEFDDKVTFLAKGYQITLKKAGIAAAYADRVYSADTEKHLLGAFADL